MKDNQENEANYLAMQILIPTKFLKKDLEDLNNEVTEDDVVILAKKYKVSAILMSRRLALLGL